MAFPQLRIASKVAEFIFEDVAFETVMVGESIGYYKATFKGYEYEDKAIVHLCKKGWNGNS